jgi:hypothetical protein
MGMFDTLLEADDALVDWILRAHPTNDGQARQMREVLAIRTNLDRTINELVAHRLKLAAQAISADANRLDEATAKLKATARTIECVQEVVQISGMVLEIAGRVLASVVA